MNPVDARRAFYTCTQDDNTLLSRLPRLGPCQMIASYILGPQLPGTIPLNRPLRLLQTIGAPGSDYGQFGIYPTIALDSRGNIVVHDFNNERIQILQPDGSFIRSFPVSREGTAGLTRMAVGPNGLVYIAHDGLKGLRAYQSEDGALVHGWWEDIPYYPSGVAITPDGSILVTNRELANLELFDSKGTLLQSLNNEYIEAFAVNPFTGDLTTYERPIWGREPSINLYQGENWSHKSLVEYSGFCESLAFDATGAIVASSAANILIYPYPNLSHPILLGKKDQLGTANVLVDAAGRIIVAESKGQISIWG